MLKWLISHPHSINSAELVVLDTIPNHMFLRQKWEFIFFPLQLDGEAVARRAYRLPSGQTAPNPAGIGYGAELDAVRILSSIELKILSMKVTLSKIRNAKGFSSSVDELKK
jgi:hypothetical protein